MTAYAGAMLSLPELARAHTDLTEADLAGAATKFIRPPEAVWVIVGDVAKIEAGIRELNLGTITRVDGDGRPVDGTR